MMGAEREASTGLPPEGDASMCAEAAYPSARTRALHARACASIAGGADSAMRVLPYHLPLVVARAEGPFVWDVDGNRLIDFNMAYGPLLFGHRPAFLLDAIRHELDIRGTVLGFPHELSCEAAELVKEAVPSIELLRFSSSGSEAVQTAVRLARAATGRDGVVMFEGHYSGSTDSVFHRYHASVEDLDARPDRLALPGTNGMPAGAPATHVLPWNDAELLGEFLEREGRNVAAVLMEPIMGNAGVIPPRAGYLEAVRALTRRHGVVLIFDEVITGFRVARGGAQERYGVASDLTVISKAMSGGMPVSAVGGRREIVALLAERTVFHGGVFSGNPLGIAATVAVQREWRRRGPALSAELEARGAELANGLGDILRRRRVPALVQRVGPMLGVTFLRDDGPDAVWDYRAQARASWPERTIALQHAAQRAGVYFHPNAYEPWFVSTAHTKEVIECALDRLDEAVGSLVRRGGLWGGCG